MATGRKKNKTLSSVFMEVAEAQPLALFGSEKEERDRERKNKRKAKRVIGIEERGRRE